MGLQTTAGSLAGYLRVPDPNGARPAPRPRAGSYLLVVEVGRGPAWPRVIGRMTLRGYLARPLAGCGCGAESGCGCSAATAPCLPPGAHLRPVGRLGTLQDGEAGALALRPIQSGRAYRVVSPPRRNLVTPALAQALEDLFERFAEAHGFDQRLPLRLALSRGYAAGDRGHGRGLAADIASVGGRGLREWKQDWERAAARARALPELGAQQATLAEEARRNLGYRLYRALLEQGGWRMYNNVVQLFGPWTDILGPWRRLRFDQPSEAQRRVMAEQERIFQAHQDHIHVAR